ncbi:hypothetical protein ACWDV4_13490 [Micromonospora sp. NPDC003197]
MFAATAAKWRRTALSTATAGLLAIGLGSAAPALAAPAPATQSNARDCSLSTSANQPYTDEWASCLSVGATLDQAPTLGATANLTVTVAADAVLPATEIRLELPAQLEWAQVPAGLTVSKSTATEPERAGELSVASTTRQLKAGEKLTFTGQVRAVKAGQAQIEARATATEPGRRHAGKDTVFLTIAAPGRVSTFGQTTTNGVAGTTATPTATRSGLPAGLRPASPGPADPVMTTAACDTWVTGNWTYADQTGAWHNAMNLTVEVVNAADGQRLAAAVSNANGDYNFCFDAQAATDPNNGLAIYVRVLTSNSLWRVQRTGSPLAFQSETFTNVAPGSTINLGSRTSDDATLQRGLHAFARANQTWLFIPKPTNNCFDQNDTTCRRLTINWAPDSTSGNYYSLANNEVHLNADAPNSPTTVIHEIGHALMDDIYNDAYPAFPNCSPHYVQRTSSTGCAWTEGWAEWFPATVLNDPFYRWPSGAYLDLENTTWGTSGWDNGDAVEGRVAAAMIDITDSTNEGSWDRYGEGFDNLWHTFTHHVSNTFAEFWTHRTADGFDVSPTGALGALYQSTIDYGFQDPLGNYAPKLLPSPTPHNFGYQTTSAYWSVVAIRAGVNHDLELYDDQAQTTRLATSAVTSGVDFIAVDSKWRALGGYHPRVKASGDAGWYRIELAQGSASLPVGTSSVTMTGDSIVAVRDLTLTAGQKVTVKITGSTTQNPELYLVSSTETTASTWVRTRAQAVASANSAGTGASETLTYTASAAGHFGLVIVNWSGTGTYQVTRS